MSWVASLGGKIQPKTIKQYLGHVKSMHTDLDLPFAPCTSPIVQRLIRGIKRYHGERDTRRKMPITLPVLQDLLRHLQPDTNPGHLGVYAAACVAFSGFLRCGEFTVKAGKAFSTSNQPTRRSIEFHPDLSNPTHARLNLPASKTDPFRKGVSIYLAAAPGATTCPVTALKRLFAEDPSDPDGPLFHNPDGSPLSREFFIETIRLALQAAGYKSKDFAGHSFRRGAASSAAAAGCQDHEIQLLGRWLSDAYKVYIDIDQNRLHFLSKSLHWVLPHNLTYEPPALHSATYLA
ncbi:hypothetical protein EST38_g14168 [Candolleomyces aberdarensis]|uniref:Tyr recombinase domain-containing protein n=1 Tax=Candolleomyces aberdarensis TaxID=2316362 RepID=A0A4Q2CXZ9_9AGAR|nr:hypothetical protein EST38_g14168 [Candolleomyces aberdarensis]